MPKKGHFILHSNVIPPVTAGPYELVTAQTGLPFSVAEEHTHVTVSAPRYTMPPEQILSTFPPANGEGAFGDRLPQIVLKRRTLPWERNPAEAIQTSPKPWLALVVVAEGEAELSGATPVAQCVTPGTSLLHAADDKDVEQGVYLAVTETVVKKIFPCEEDLELLVHVREVDVNDTELANGDDDGWLAVVLANRLPVFDTATGKAVRYMACLVNIEGQLSALPKPEPFDDHFRFELAQDWSVIAAVASGPDPHVMGGIDVGDLVLPRANVLLDAGPGGPARARAAQAGAVKTAASARVGAALDGAASMAEPAAAKTWTSATEKVAAVALDPDAKRLVRDTMGAGFRYPIELIAAEKVYRFPVLAHWSFTTNEGATFETLMQDLDVGLLGTVPAPAEGAPPPAGPGPKVVETGHISLAHRARRGDAVDAWYRGPFVPFPTLREKPVDGVLKVAHSADQIRPVVPDGREDLSLAAAFEIGRLLGLSQLSVVAALLRFRGEQFGVGRARELLDGITAFEIPAIVDQRVDLGRFVALRTLSEMAKNPAEVIGPRRPVADPGREVVVQGDLDAVVAHGLGLDLAALRARGGQVGVLAALVESRVPVAARGGVVVSQAAAAGLRGALAAEVAHVVGVAAPPQIIRTRATRGARAGAQAAPAPDALDELIQRASARVYDDPEDS
jgi:hypothetical protein